MRPHAVMGSARQNVKKSHIGNHIDVIYSNLQKNWLWWHKSFNVLFKTGKSLWTLFENFVFFLCEILNEPSNVSSQACFVWETWRTSPDVRNCSSSSRSYWLWMTSGQTSGLRPWWSPRFQTNWLSKKTARRILCSRYSSQTFFTCPQHGFRGE